MDILLFLDICIYLDELIIINNQINIHKSCIYQILLQLLPSKGGQSD